MYKNEVKFGGEITKDVRVINSKSSNDIVGAAFMVKYRKQLKDRSTSVTVPFTVWGHNAKSVREARVGDFISTDTGELVINSWEGKDGVKRFSTEVHTREVTLTASARKAEPVAESSTMDEADFSTPF